MLDASMKRQRFQPDALIEVLHTAQELFGYLQDDILLYVAHGLKLPPSRVYGVATFYHFFTFTPKGAHTCVVCMGTACYVKGAETLLATVREVRGRDEPGGRRRRSRSSRWRPRDAWGPAAWPRWWSSTARSAGTSSRPRPWTG